MDQQLCNSFEKIGARARVTFTRENSVMGRRVPFTINIRSDRKGSYFDLLQREDAKVEVLEESVSFTLVSDPEAKLVP